MVCRQQEIVALGRIRLLFEFHRTRHQSGRSIRLHGEQSHVGRCPGHRTLELRRTRPSHYPRLPLRRHRMRDPDGRGGMGAGTGPDHQLGHVLPRRRDRHRPGQLFRGDQRNHPHHAGAGLENPPPPGQLLPLRVVQLQRHQSGLPDRHGPRHIRAGYGPSFKIGCYSLPCC